MQKTKKIAKFLLISLICFGCVSCGSAVDMYNLDPQDKIMYSIINRTYLSLARKYNLNLIGQGGSSDINNKTTAMEASFQIQKNLSIEEARCLILEASHLFLDVINQNNAFRSYLHHYPFKIKDIDVVFYIRNKKNETPADPEISVVSLHKGKIEYCTVEKGTYYPYKSVITETYEEALEIAGSDKECKLFSSDEQSRMSEHEE